MEDHDVDESRQNRALGIIIALISCLIVVNIAIEVTLILR